MQVRTEEHTSEHSESEEQFIKGQDWLGESGKKFFKLFQESTFEGSQAAALKMKKMMEPCCCMDNEDCCCNKDYQKFLLFYSLDLRSDSEMLLWPNSPLLVLLQFVDPNVLCGNEDEDVSREGDEERETPLNHLASLAAPSDYSTHINQLILAKQLVEHGANVNAVSIPNGMTPLHWACNAGVVTNLDMIEFLLVEGADPNAQILSGKTPLMCTVELSPGAAKFLLNWPTTDASITMRSGPSFVAAVKKAVEVFSDKVAFPGNLDQVQHKFLLQQWRDIEEMLVERVC
jgi:hypothetical protein